MVSAIDNEETLMHFSHPDSLSLLKTALLVSVPEEYIAVSFLAWFC